MSKKEMDTSRFKRREIQTRRQTVKRLYGNSDVAPRAVDTYPGNEAVTPVSQTQPQQPAQELQKVEVHTRPAIQPVDPLPPQKPIEIAKPISSEPKSQEVIAADYWQRMIPVDMNLPGQVSAVRSPKTVVRTGKTFTGRRLAFRAVAIVLVLIIGLGGVLFSQGFMKLHKTFKGNAATAAALTVNVNPSQLKGEGDGRVNVLLLGRGGGNHDGPDLTDSMMLASIDPINHTASLISIPRDLWINIPSNGSMKINAAWETGEFNYLGKVETGSTNPNAITGGFNQVDQTVESVLGVPIDYNVIVDFAAFQQAVNDVNGVTVNVPTELFDPTMAWENNNNPILAEPGTQNFDGNQALNYVRSRETTSDFARAQRQRTVLVALKDKVETLGTLSNPLKIDNLFNAFSNNVATDLSLSDADKLYGVVKDIAGANIQSIGLADSPNNFITTGILDGQSIDLPTAGLYNYSAIQSFVRSQLKDPYILKENAKILVLNGTDVPGLATNETNILKTYGYNVIAAANAPTNSYVATQLIDLTHGNNKYTSNYLQKRFNVKAQTAMPDNTIQTDGADFVIILGSDAASSQQN